MAKPYPEQLAEWVKQRKSTRRDKNLVAFLVIREDVKAAIEAGFSVKTVWENMHESKRIEFGYDTFLNYVNRQIRQPQASRGATHPEPTPQVTTDRNHTKPDTEQNKPATKITKPGVLTAFTYNPIPNIEDLI